MMTCEQIRELLDEYRMTRLGPEEAATVAAHLAGCQACREELEQLQELNDTLSVERAEIPGAEYFTALQEKLKQRIAAEENAANLDEPVVQHEKVMEVQDRVPRRYRWMEIAAAFLIGASAMLLLQSLEERQTTSDETHIALSRKKDLAFIADEATRKQLPAEETEVEAKDTGENLKAEESIAAPAAASPIIRLRNETSVGRMGRNADKQVDTQESKNMAQASPTSEQPLSAPRAAPPSSPDGTTQYYQSNATDPTENLLWSRTQVSKENATAEKAATALTTATRINPMALLQEINRNADNDKPSPAVDISGALAAAQAAAPTPEPVHVWRSRTLSSAAPETTSSTDAIATYLGAEDTASAGSTAEAIRKFTDAAASNPDSHLALRATLRIAELQEASGNIPQALEKYRECLQPPLLSYASAALRDEIERRIARLVVR